MNDLTDAAAFQARIDARQNNRLLRLIYPNNDGPEALMVANKLDAYEGLSRDFHFMVEVLSEDSGIELKDVMGKMVAIELVCADGEMRYFNGHVFDFRLTKVDGGFAPCFKKHLRNSAAYTPTRCMDFHFLRRWVVKKTWPILA